MVDLFIPPAEFKKWKPLLTEIDYELFVLLPYVETTVYRAAHRNGKMTEAKIRKNHEWFTHWNPDQATLIDTSNQTLEETVNLIMSKIN